MFLRGIPFFFIFTHFLPLFSFLIENFRIILKERKALILQGFLVGLKVNFTQTFGRPLTRFGRPARSARFCCAPHSGERSRSTWAREGCGERKNDLSGFPPSAYAEGLQDSIRTFAGAYAR